MLCAPSRLTAAARLLAAAGRTAAGLGRGRSAGLASALRRASSGADQFDAEVPPPWFELALDLVTTTPGYSPPVAARGFGYAGVTRYEAVAPVMEG